MRPRDTPERKNGWRTYAQRAALAARCAREGDARADARALVLIRPELDPFLRGLLDAYDASNDESKEAQQQVP